jgi:thioredoxin 1
MEIKNEQDLNEALKNNKYILVDLWAEWCMPCKTLMPILDQLKDLVAIYKCNIDEYPDLAVEFGIQKIPTLLLLNKDKTLLASKSGVYPKSILENWIKENEPKT